MASLYELTYGLQTLWDLMEEGALDEELLLDAFKNQEEEISIKLEGYCKFLKNLESDIAGLKAEEDRLKARRKAMENTREKMKTIMRDAVIATGEKKIPCGTFTVSVQANPSKVVMDEQYIENIPEEYLKYAEPDIDRALIKRHLEAGVLPEGIAHLETEVGVRIR